MSDVTPLQADTINSIPSVPIHSLPEDEDKLHATLEDRIYNIIGKELLDKAYKPTAYAMAVLNSSGDPAQVIYQYTKIRYTDLHERALRRLKHSSDVKV